MPRLSVGTLPIQVAWLNEKRFSVAAQMLPTGIEAGNTGLVYGKFGSAPVAAAASNSWDFVLNAGASDGSNVNEQLPEAPDKRDLWLVSDTAAQIVNVTEKNVHEKAPVPV
ncbi:MAG: hypothetical protein HY471_03165 [Candidatus Sungbacteria bacterium]|nr:hypothetical protein [Candidatus Sungbacteria bacterium]